MKFQTDKHHREVQFNVGDMVYLRLQPYMQRSLVRRLNEKLDPRFYGPFKIIQKLGSVAYKLDLPTGVTIHPVFHVSQLKPAIGNTQVSPVLLTQLSADLELQVYPESLLGICRAAMGKTTNLEVLMHWSGLPSFEDSWEPYDVIKDQFPDFHLEDKVTHWGEIIDKPPVRITYVRRVKRGNFKQDDVYGLESFPLLGK